MNIELFSATLAALFVLGFVLGFKKFHVPRCIKKLYVAVISEFAASTEPFTKKKLLNVLESHVETQELLNDLDELKKCVRIVYSALGRKREKLPEGLDELKAALVDGIAELFVRRGVFTIDGNRFRVHNVLNMLTHKHYVEAKNVTRNDDILYGAYQVRHITSFRAVFLEFLPLLAAFVLAVVVPAASYYYPGLSRIVDALNPRGAPLPLRSLFVLALGILLKDVTDNAVKAYFREKYRVVIGRLSGVRYDLTYDDRLSGNIRRRLVGKSAIDLQQSFRQRVFSRFSSVPVGDIKIRMPANEAVRRENPGLIDEAIFALVECLRDLGIKNIGSLEDKELEETAKKLKECASKKSKKAGELSVDDIKEIFDERPRYIVRRFRNMPYPNEMYKALKTLQLGHIRRRMKHADKILMRKGGAVASFGTKRRRSL